MRGRPKIRKPHCTKNHQYGYLILSSDNKPIRKCKHCPAIQTKSEYLKEKMLRIEERSNVNISHLDLFYF